MVVRQVNDIEGDRKQFLEDLLGQQLAKNAQVYIMVCGDEPIDEVLQQGKWSTAKNSRRCELIDKHIQGSIGREERIELDFLQQQFHEQQELNCPLPIDKATELHGELLEKKRLHEETQG